jgi:hypothetical protein
MPNIAKLRSDLMQFVELNPIIDRLYQYQKEHSEFESTVRV